MLVTGDLFHTPNDAFLNKYLEFRADFQRIIPKPMIVIPGNHDVREGGRGKQRFEFITDVGWQPLVVDDDIECVFFCFNSAEKGPRFARGSVSDEQMKRLGTSFNEERELRRRQKMPDIDAYSKVALVHHHPFPYGTVPTARYDAVLRKITGDEDTFTRFERASNFVSWCAEKEVSLILHGHKHVAHHVQASIDKNGHKKSIVVIGCGSTTGAEKSPLSYDVISLNPITRKWAVTFYSDRSAAAANFNIDEVTLDMRSERLA